MEALINRPGKKPLRVKRVKGDFTKNGQRYRYPTDNEIQTVPSLCGDRKVAIYLQGVPRPFPIRGIEYVMETRLIDKTDEKGKTVLDGGGKPVQVEGKILVAKQLPKPEGLGTRQMEMHYGATPARVLSAAFSDDEIKQIKLYGLISLCVNAFQVLLLAVSMYGLFRIGHYLKLW